MKDADKSDGRHFVHYAKGNYVMSTRTMRDLQTISKKIGAKDTPENIVVMLSNIAWQAILESAPPIDGMGKIVETNGALAEYREQMLFLWKCKEEVIGLYGAGLLDDIEQADERSEVMLTEQMLRSLLVIIARWNTEIDIGEPDPKIMTVANPKRKKEVKSE